nr:hypothetical protein [Tanacetum cinerariifolium]
MWNDAHYGYDCPPQVPFVYNQDPCFNQDLDNNFPQTSPSFRQQYLYCENCEGPHTTFQCQPMNQNSNSFGFDQYQPPHYPVIYHPPQETSVEILQARENLMQSIQTFLKKFNLISFRETPKELAEYINSLSWNSPTFYDDDDDDEYSIQVSGFLKKSPIAIAPVLPTEEPDNSLSMGDEHLSTILEMKSDEIIKSSVENLVPIPSESEGISDDTCDDINYAEASPPDSELVSLEEVKDDIPHAKLLNIRLLIAKIKSLNKNPTPDCVLKYPSSSFLFYSDNSLPEFETFSDHTEETSSGSTTTHADNSLPKYDSFLFEIEPDQGFRLSSSDDSLGSDLEISFPSGTRNKILDPRIFLEVQSKRFLSHDLEASRARGFVHRLLKLQSLAYGNPIS